MTVVPKFDFPLRYVNGAAIVVEQDSSDDIGNCVEAICLTNIGDRAEYPEFGITDPAFGQQPINPQYLQNQIEQFEPRVQLLIDSAPDEFDLSVANVNIDIEGNQ